VGGVLGAEEVGVSDEAIAGVDSLAFDLSRPLEVAHLSAHWRRPCHGPWFRLGGGAAEEEGGGSWRLVRRARRAAMVDPNPVATYH
jgi:hypothetical protein